MRIPFVDLAARHAEVAAIVERRVIEVLRSGRWVGGPVVEEAERCAAAALDRRAASAVGSGTDALIFALQALGVERNDEVIVPALTFVATAGAVLALGAVPVIADVGEDALLDPSSAERLRGPKTRAIIPVHLFGNPAPLPSLDLPVIEDAAQAVGASFSGARGALCTLSTYPTKTWGSAGDGGFVAGDDDEILLRVKRLGNHGAVAPHLYERIGAWSGRNSRLDAVQAAVLVSHAERLRARVEDRRRRAHLYDEGLPPWARPVPRPEGSAVQLYCVRVPQRDTLQQRLLQRGVETAIYYPRHLADQPLLQGCPRDQTPVADALCRELLALPIADITDAQVASVLEALEEAGP